MGESVNIYRYQQSHREDDLGGVVTELNGKIRHSYKSGGYIIYDKNIRQSKAELKNNLNTYAFLARTQGDRYELLPIKDGAGVKNPDARNLRANRLSDAKHPTSENAKRAIQRSIESAGKQEVKEVIIRTGLRHNRQEEYSAMRAAFQPGRADTIRKVVIIYGDGLTRVYYNDSLNRMFRRRE